MDQNRKFTTRKVEPRRETMVVFDPNVSDDEFDKASQPTRQDWAAAAYALGMALTFDLPTVEALRLTAVSTSNPRLRRILSNAAEFYQLDETLAQAFGEYSGTVKDDEFVTTCRRGEMGQCLPEMLLAYARYFTTIPDPVGDQIGRSGWVQILTVVFAHDQARHIGILITIRRMLKMAGDEAKEKMNNLAFEIEAGYMLHEAMAKQPDVFDPLYVAIVKAGGESNRLALAFELLASS